MLEIKLKKSDGSYDNYKYRKDTSGFFGLLLMKMGYNVGGYTTFKSSNLLKDNPVRVDDGNDHAFSYKENKDTMDDDKKLKLGELRTGDLIVTDNMMWMFGYVTHEVVGTTVTKIKIYGLDFCNGLNIEQLSNAINNLESANSSYAVALANLFQVVEIPNITPLPSDKTNIDEIIADTLNNTTDDAVKLAIRYIGKDNTSDKFEDEWQST